MHPVYHCPASRLATAGEESVITSNSGNITSDSVFTYTYDGLHRLIQVNQVNQGNTLVVQYSYDGLDRRVRKSAGGQTTYYYYDLRGKQCFLGQYFDEETGLHYN
jgi:YD repeat-containing protein